MSELIEDGSDLAGALIGTTLGIVGGPPGALLGAAAGITVSRACKTVAGRLAGRERERAGAAMAIIELDTTRRQESGEDPREDGFFDRDGKLRSDAEELLEGVLRVAAASYEERKVPYLAHLFAKVAFDARIVASEAQYLVRLADSLTYQQFVALAVFAHADEHSADLIGAAVAHGEGTSAASPAFMAELDDLGERYLVGLLTSGRVARRGETYETSNPLSLIQDAYGRLRLLPAGDSLVRAAQLDLVAVEERCRWIDALRGVDRPEVH